MDPFSITTGVVAVATLATQVADAFITFRTICKELTGRVHALSNEVADLQVVLQQLTAVIEERRHLTNDDQLHIPSLVSQAPEKLEEIKKIVEALINLCASGNKVFLRASQ